MNYFEHHIGDYDADTSHLTWVEDMAYTRLMRLYYRKEAPIPADVNEACRLVRATSKDQRQAVAAVLTEFFSLQADGWHQKRCDADVERYQKKANHNREVGKLGGRPKKVGTQNEPTNNPVGSFREPKQNPLQTPDTRHQTPKKEKAKAAPSLAPADLAAAGFDEATAAEFIACKAARKAPLTARALADHLREAEKAGWSPVAAAEKVMAKTWKGFEAKYVADEAKPPRAMAVKSFRAHDAEARRAEVSAWSGGILGRKPAGEIIDMEHPNGTLARVG